MISRKMWEAAGRMYDNVEAALWTSLILFLIYFFVFIVPKLPEVRAQNQRILVQEVAAENESYCTRLGMERGTEKYSQCLLVLGEFRAKVEKLKYAEEFF